MGQDGMAEGASSRNAAVFFISSGLAVVGAWGVLCAVTGTPSQEPSRPAIKLVMGSDPISAESEMSWGSLETRRFGEYCRRRGWGNIDVTVTTAVGDYFQKYIASTVAGEGADVIMVGPTDVVYFADHDLIEPLDEYIEKWDAYREGHITEEVLEMCRGTDGKVLGFPFAQVGPMFFAIRRDWLDHLSLEAPDTFEEAYDVWRAFTFEDPDGNGKDDTHGYAISMKTEGGDHVWRITPFMLAACVNWYEPDESGKFVPAFNTPDGAFVLDFIKKAYKEGLFGKDVMFRTDKIAVGYRFFSEQVAGMCGNYTPNWYKTSAMRFGVYDKMQIVPFLWKDEDAKSENRYSTWAGLSSFRCIMKDSRNKKAAWRYLEYFFSREHQEQYFSLRGPPLYRARYLGRFGMYAGEPPWLPLRSDLDVEARLDEEMERIVRPLDGYVVATPRMAAWSEAAVALAEVFVDYYLDRNYATARDALDEAERRFLRIVEEYERELSQHPRKPKERERS